MKPSRFASSLIVMLAFMIPIMVGVVVTGDLNCLWGVVPILVIYIWQAIELRVLGVNVKELTKAAWLTLIMGLIVSILVVISKDSVVLWMTAAMMIGIFPLYYFI